MFVCLFGRLLACVARLRRLFVCVLGCLGCVFDGLMFACVFVRVCVLCVCVRVFGCMLVCLFVFLVA